MITTFWYIVKYQNQNDEYRYQFHRNKKYLICYKTYSCVKPVFKFHYQERKDVEFILHLLWLYMMWIPNIFSFYDLRFWGLRNFLYSPPLHIYTKNMIAYDLFKIFHSHTMKTVFILLYNITILPIILRGREHVIKFHHIFMTRYFILTFQQQFCWAL